MAQSSSYSLMREAISSPSWMDKSPCCLNSHQGEVLRLIAPKFVSKDFAQVLFSLLCRARQPLLGGLLLLRLMVFDKTLESERFPCLQLVVDPVGPFVYPKLVYVTQEIAVSLGIRHSYQRSHGPVCPSVSELADRMRPVVEKEEAAFSDMLNHHSKPMILAFQQRLTWQCRPHVLQSYLFPVS